MPHTISMIFTTYAGTIKNVVFDLRPAAHEDEKALHEHHSKEAVAAGVAADRQAATTQTGIRRRIRRRPY